MNAYFDTSAFFKLVVEEPGSDRAEETWIDADRAMSSLLLYPEARAALARAVRMRRLTAAEKQAAHRGLEAFWRHVTVVAIDAAIAQAAAELSDTHALRAYDAVHLASALSVADEELALVTSDDDLLAAAQASGLATVAL